MKNQFFVPPHMAKLANSTVRSLSYDTSNSVDYHINSIGFRGPELENTRSVIVIGNSVGFGLGIEFENTFGYLVSKDLGLPVANFAFGGCTQDNADYVQNIKLLSQRPFDDIFIVQINNINQHSDINQYFDTVEQLLKNKSRVYVMWDSSPVPDAITSKLLIHNKFHLDKSLPDYPDTFGIMSNRAIAKVIAGSLAQSKSQTS